MSRSAAMFIPWDYPDRTHDVQYSREGIAHIASRRYEFGGIYREWAQVEEAIKTLGITVIVFARRDHFDPRCPVSAEFVGEETRQIAWSVPPKDQLGSHRPTNSPTHAEGAANAPVVPLNAGRHRQTEAARLVEDAARRQGFAPRQAPRWDL